MKFKVTSEEMESRKVTVVRGYLKKIGCDTLAAGVVPGTEEYLRVDNAHYVQFLADEMRAGRAFRVRHTLELTSTGRVRSIISDQSGTPHDIYGYIWGKLHTAEEIAAHAQNRRSVEARWPQYRSEQTATRCELTLLGKGERRTCHADTWPEVYRVAATWAGYLSAA